MALFNNFFATKQPSTKSRQKGLFDSSAPLSGTAVIEEGISGSVTGVVFTNDTNFTVFRFLSVLGDEFTATVQGLVSAGQALTLYGEWVKNDRFGEQYKVNDFRQIQPRSKEALSAFFASGVAKNVGKKFATNIVSHFGERLPDILALPQASAIKELSSVPGIGKKRATEIFRAWQEEAEFRDLMDFVVKAGLKASDAARIKKVGLGIKDIRRDPYKLMDVLPWAGFKRIDALALEAGVPANSKARINAGTTFLLEDWSRKFGHTAMREEQFITDLGVLLSIQIKNIEETGAVRTGIEDLVALPEVFRTEQWIAGNIASRIDQKPFSSSILESIREIQTGIKKITLTEEQFSAVKGALENKLYVLTGGPGTGKTTIVKAYLAAIRASGIGGDKVVLCAPTGRAARRLEEATGFMAMTVHRAIGFGMGEENRRPSKEAEEKEGLPIQTAEVVVVDESSMLDINLTRSLLDKVPYHAKILFVGDPYQLPSIGPGRVLGDMIESGKVPSSELTFVHRQGTESSIPAVADNIKRGIVPRVPVSGDVSMLLTRTGNETAKTIVDLYSKELLHGTSLTDVQVITAMHKGSAGTTALNQALQGVVIPADRKHVFLSNAFCRFHVGDKIMQTRNDYNKGVMNGEIGSVVFIDKKNETLLANFDNGQAKYEKSDLEDLQLAYAISAHKSQGGEYKKVIMVVDMSQSFMLERHLLYTGVTRGKEKVALVGSNQALNIAVKTVKAINRLTTLNHDIKEKMNHKRSMGFVDSFVR